jgi:hypothetical protein
MYALVGDLPQPKIGGDYRLGQYDMTTIKASELVTLINNAEIVRINEHIGENDVPVDPYDVDNYDKTTVVDSYSVSQHVEIDGLKILGQTVLDVPRHKPTEASFNHDTGITPAVTDECTLAIFDIDGDEMAAAEFIRDYNAELNICQQWDVSDWLDIAPNEDPNEDIDVIGDTHNTHIVQRDDEVNLRFTGERIGYSSSSANNAHSDYSGSNGRWTELKLYKTAMGKYICEQIGHTQWQGEKTRYSGKVCETVEEVLEFFGHRWLARNLYSDAGIALVQDVD